MNNNQIIDSVIQYKNKKCFMMTEDEIKKTSELFSNHYGKWSLNHPNESLRGKRVKLSKDKIKDFFVNKPDRYVAMAFIGDELVGHIFYLKRKGEKTSDIIWILQLIVNEEYRGNGIGTKLMHSIWGLSNCYAWGLFTSNPRTIRALEKATMRKVDLNQIEKKFEKIKDVAYDIFDDENWLELQEGGTVNTSFFVDHSFINDKIKKAYKKMQFPLSPDLPEGHEWLAFTFKSQEPRIESLDELDDYLNYSKDIIKNAYSKMNMQNQPWTFHAKEEISYLCDNYINEKDKVLDVGCGIGRHTIELKNRGINVIGIDFSETHINSAKSMYGEEFFICDDVRKHTFNDEYDVVLALYDVIGSFPKEKENYEILRKIWNILKPNGMIILSVMNMEFTQKICKNHIKSIDDDIGLLLKLEGSKTMQNTGNVFIGDSMLIEDNTGIVYRKEQFISENSLPCEYIIRDRRYTTDGIEKLLNRSGFKVMNQHCFNANDMSVALSPKKGREILVVAQKKSYWSLISKNTFIMPKAWK